MKNWTKAATGTLLILAFSAMAVGDESIRIVTSSSIELLKDLGEVSVVADVNDYAEQEGFTQAAIVERVSQELKDSGVTVVSDERSNHTDSQGYVYMQVMLLGEQAVITLSFNERVLLFRNKKTVVIGARTYSDVYTGPHGNSKSKVWRAISRAVTEFSFKHMQANKVTK